MNLHTFYCYPILSLILIVYLFRLDKVFTLIIIFGIFTTEDLQSMLSLIFNYSIILLE